MYSEMFQTAILLTVLYSRLARSQEDHVWRPHVTQPIWKYPGKTTNNNGHITKYWCEDSNYRLAPGESFYSEARSHGIVFREFYSNCISQQTCTAPEWVVDGREWWTANHLSSILVCLPDIYFTNARTTGNISTIDTTKGFGFLVARPGSALSHHYHTFYIRTQEGCGAGLIIYYVYAQPENYGTQLLTSVSVGERCQTFWYMPQRIKIKSSASISFQPCEKVVRFCIGYFSACRRQNREYLWDEPFNEYTKIPQSYHSCQTKQLSKNCIRSGLRSTTQKNSPNSPSSTDSPHLSRPTEIPQMPTQIPDPDGTDGQTQLDGAVVGGSIAGGLILALILLAIILVILWKRKCLILPVPKPKPTPMTEMEPSTLSASNVYQDVDEAYSEPYQYVVPPKSWPDSQPTAQSNVQPDVLPHRSGTDAVVNKRKGSLTLVENDLYDNVQNIDQTIGQKGNASRASAGIYIVENDACSGGQ